MVNDQQAEGILSVMDIQKILDQQQKKSVKEVDSTEPDTVKEAENVVFRLLFAYWELSGEYPFGIGIDQKTREKIYAFQDVIADYKDFLPNITNAITSRVLSSEITSLFFLYCTNLFQTFAKTYKEQNPNASDEELLHAQAKFAHEYIQKVEAKNAERGKSDNEIRLSTTGFEYEFSSALQDVVTLYNSAISQLDYLSERYSDEKNRIEVLKHIVQTLKPYFDEILELSLALKTKDKNREKNLDRFSPKIIGRSQRPPSAIFESLTKLVPSGYRLSEWLGVYSTNMNVFGYDEASTNPSFSLETQLRELIQLVKSEIISPKINPHQTIEGVRLTRTRTEYMETASMLSAAGCFQNRKLTLDRHIQARWEEMGIQESTSIGKVREIIKMALLEPEHEWLYPEIYKYVHEILRLEGIEAHPKPIPTDISKAEYTYFPHFKPRNISDNLQNYPNEDIDPTNFVEVRGYPNFDLTNNGDLRKFVFSAHFYYYAGLGEKFSQLILASKNVSVLERKIADRWGQLLLEWKQLQLDQGLSHIMSKDKFIDIPPDMINHSYMYISDNVENPFLELTNAISILAEVQEEEQPNNPANLQFRSRNLMREYMRDLKKIIQEGERKS